MTALAGTPALVRLALRRDRLLAPVAVVVIAGTVLGTASAITELYPTAAARERFGTSVSANPAILALTGPVFDLGSVGGLTAWRTSGIAALLGGLASGLLVVRHTRAEEEAGRLELVGAAAVGRQAPLAAALLVALGFNGVVTLVLTLGLMSQGLPGAGSATLGLAVAGAGCVFATLAAVAAQLAHGGRAANGILGGLLGLAFFLRAAGDSSGPAWLSWLSPVGWTQQARPFAGERPWVLGLLAAVALALAALAHALTARRDLGEGLLPERPGPTRGGAALRTPLALAWRLQRGLLAGWALGFLALGAAVGAVASGVGDIFESTPQLRDLLPGGEREIVDAYLALTMGSLGLMAAVEGVQAAMRLRSEEAAGRAEPVLATAVGRVRWALGHVALAAAGPAALLATGGLAAGLVHGARTGDVAGEAPRVLAAALVQLPAAWVLAGLAVGLWGIAPRLAPASWAALVAVLLLGQLGPLLGLDQRVLDLSPFAHVPALPGADVTPAPLAALTALAAGLTAIGLAGVRRRDVG